MEERMETEYENEGFHKSPIHNLIKCLLQEEIFDNEKEKMSNTTNCYIIHPELFHRIEL